ncbi:HAD family phosphatase [Vibrio lamellibrachiae]|uniref:HAD family hydrolase n=1 Tax=Vibrio lamellibrachiae TaxID=2910253 RepID=UPI003D10A705
MIKAVLFDMDGLIFDTESVYKQSWKFAAKEQSLLLTDDFYQQFIGVQDTQCEQILYSHCTEQIDIVQYIKVRNAHFSALRQQGISFKPGFDELFRVIKNLGLTTAIVTSSRLEDVQQNFRSSEYLNQFELIITAEDVTRSKPKPDCYLLACRKLSLDPKECLVLEDSNHGINAALSAGCQAIMIPDLLPPLAEFKDQIHIVTNLKDVIPYLEDAG